MVLVSVDDVACATLTQVIDLKAGISLLQDCARISLAIQ
jgi:hypothetical protein